MKNKLFFFFFLFPFFAYAQEVEIKDLTIIMVVNDRVANSGVNEFKFIIEDSVGNNKTIKSIRYLPGKVTISQKDYEELNSNSIKSITLLFSQYKSDDDKNPQLYNYEIDFKKVWVEYPYVIIYVYNTEFKKYKKRFIPISKEKKYTYEYSTPGISMLVPRKK